jgi:hypothetical protein
MGTDFGPSVQWKPFHWNEWNASDFSDSYTYSDYNVSSYSYSYSSTSSFSNASTSSSSSSITYGRTGYDRTDYINHIEADYSIFARALGWQATEESLEKETLVAYGCNVTSGHDVMVCWSTVGVGAEHHWTVEVGMERSNASRATTSYTPPAVTEVDALDSLDVVQRFDRFGSVASPSDTPAKLVFPTLGGNSIVVRGTNFGPISATNPINVEIAHRALASNGYLQGFGAEAAAVYELLNCAVTQSHVQVECVVPSGVGHDHRWRVTTGSQISLSLANFTSSYARPEIVNLELVAIAGTKDSNLYGETTLEALETLGGDVVEFTGTNFGPRHFANSGVYAVSWSSTCVECTLVSLNWTDHRDMHNYQARNCTIVSQHTKMRCEVPPGGRFFLIGNSSFTHHQLLILTPFSFLLGDCERSWAKSHVAGLHRWSGFPCL